MEVGLVVEWAGCRMLLLRLHLAVLEVGDEGKVRNLGS